MIITMDISIYPMDKNYSPIIRDFIDRIQKYQGIHVKVQAMSTIITGEYNLCMEMIKDELGYYLDSDQTIVSVIKIINADLTDV